MSARGEGARLLREEAAAVAALADRLGEEFETAVRWIVGCTGRVVLCGIGKSGHVARKAAGTFASTGSPAFFLHAAEAVHGDLGMVTADDVVIVLTHSGETDEIVRLYPSFAAAGARSVLVTGRSESSAARLSDLVLDTGVRREACRQDLAPTTSTTAMLALTDALAIAAMEERGFGREAFARFHPAGALGKRLLLRVRDVMRRGDDLAAVGPDADLLQTMGAIARAGAGAACVLGPGDALVGFVTEGDLRRHLLATEDVHAPVAAFMNRSPHAVEPGLLAFEALEDFQNFPTPIGEAPVLEEGRVVGLLMLKDLLRSGIV